PTTRLRTRRRFAISSSSFFAISDYRPDKAFAEQNGEQQEKIKERESKKLLCAFLILLPPDLDGQQQKERTQNRGADTVREAGIAHEIGHDGDREEQGAVKNDMPAGDVAPGDDRQHRHAGIGVVDIAPQRQRPEMRRRPHENNGKKNERFKAHIARNGGPSDHRRERAGGAADDNILRRAALQPDRIDKYVKGDRDRKQGGGNIVDRKPHQHDGGDRENRAERKRFFRAHPAGRNGPALRPLHNHVDVGVIPHIDGAGRAGPDRNAEQCRKGEHRMQAAGRNREADQTGKDNKRHYPGFQQSEIIADPRQVSIDAGLDGFFYNACVRHKRLLSPYLITGSSLN